MGRETRRVLRTRAPTRPHTEVQSYPGEDRKRDWGESFPGVSHSGLGRGTLTERPLSPQLMTPEPQVVGLSSTPDSTSVSEDGSVCPRRGTWQTGVPGRTWPGARSRPTYPRSLRWTVVSTIPQGKGQNKRSEGVEESSPASSGGRVGEGSRRRSRRHASSAVGVGSRTTSRRSF